MDKKFVFARRFLSLVLVFALIGTLCSCAKNNTGLTVRVLLRPDISPLWSDLQVTQNQAAPSI